jgi:hypothetical protein
MTLVAPILLALALATPEREFPPGFAPYIFELAIKAVRQGDNRPIARARLLVSGGNEAMGKWEKRATTDAQGMVRIRLPVGDYAVYPIDAAFAGVWSWITLTDKQEVVVVALQPACAIDGRVVDAEGKPLAGSRVETMVGMSIVERTTDDRGTFRIDRLPAGTHVLTAHASGHSFTDLPVTLRRGQHRRNVAIVLQRGATLTVTALCGGATCAGALVAVDGAGDGDYSELVVDAAGVAAFPDLRAGEMKIRGFKDKDRPGELVSPWVTRTLAGGDIAFQTVELAPTGGRGTIRGQVFTKSGKPLFASIDVDCAGVRRYCSTERDGAFIVRDLPDGRRCKLTASRDEARTEVETDGSAPLRLVIDTELHP